MMSLPEDCRGDTVVQNLVGSFVTEFEEGHVKE